MPIPCPDHMPQAWAIYQRLYPKIDWKREAEIARSCCANCAEGEGAVLSPSEGQKP